MSLLRSLASEFDMLWGGETVAVSVGGKFEVSPLKLEASASQSPTFKVAIFARTAIPLAGIVALLERS